MAPRALWELAPRFSGFAAVALLPALSSVVLLPVLATSGRPDEWVSVAVGQSIGLVGAVTVNLGWSAVGPLQLASTASSDRAALYVDSLAGRALALAVVAPLAACLAFVLSPHDATLLGVLVAVAFASTGLSPRWFGVARAQPGSIIRWDVLPLVTTNLVTAAIVAAGASLIVYPVLFMTVSVICAFAFPLGGDRRRPSINSVRSSVRGHGIVTLAELLGTGYSTATVALVSSQVAASAMPEYASGYRLYQWGLLVLLALTNSLQAWVASPDGDRHQRFSAVVWLHLVVGLVGLTGLVAAGPMVSRALFGADLEASRHLCLIFGLAYCAVSMSTALARHILVVGQRLDIGLRCTLAACVIGVPVTLLGASHFGVAGGAVGLLVGEVVVLLLAAPTALGIMRGASDGRARVAEKA